MNTKEISKLYGEFIDYINRFIPDKGDNRLECEYALHKLIKALQEDWISVEDIFKKIAHFDMEKEFMSAENFCDGDYEDAEHLYLSLPSCIVNVIARDYLDGSAISEILKTVKIKCRDIQEEVIDDKQVPMDLPKPPKKQEK